MFFGDYNDIEVWAFNGPGVFNEQQARELNTFIKENKDKEICYVHCSAGISRSGAIATHIFDLYGESFDEFKHMNPQIQPNIDILTKLRKYGSR